VQVGSRAARLADAYVQRDSPPKKHLEAQSGIASVSLVAFNREARFGANLPGDLRLVTSKTQVVNTLLGITRFGSLSS
jgi:hypothetical protein